MLESGRLQGRTTSFKDGPLRLTNSALTGDVQPRAQTALANSPIYELRDLNVEAHNGALLITGSVSSFYHKQVAQEVVRSVCEGFDVINSICVE
jgi:hypothetical protein